MGKLTDKFRRADIRLRERNLQILIADILKVTDGIIDKIITCPLKNKSKIF